MIKVFMANRPPLKEYDNVYGLLEVNKGELSRISSEAGNHWRKIFNVYAKFMYSFGTVNNDKDVLNFQTWQQYRDERLLQEESGTSLYFEDDSLVDVLSQDDIGSVRIVMGKAFAEKLLKDTVLTWQDSYFAINEELRIIVCPYFDYRQLSNVRIETLVKYVLLLNRNVY